MSGTAQERLIDEPVSALIDALELAQDAQSISFALKRFTRDSGFEKFAYAKLKGTQSQIYSDYPEEWQNQYVENNYLIADPVVATAKRLLQPFAWSAEQMVPQGGAIKRIALEADSFGIRAGISIPVRAGFGATAMLTLATKSQEAATAGFRDVISASAAVAYLHAKMAHLSVQMHEGLPVLLSPRELTCLAWAAQGKTKADTAAMIGIKEKTVRFYLESARKKLGAANTVHTVKVAADRKLL